MRSLRRETNPSVPEAQADMENGEQPWGDCSLAADAGELAFYEHRVLTRRG